MTVPFPTYAYLTTQLGDSDADTRRRAIRQLAFWQRKRALAPLQRMLRDSVIAVRLEAIRALRLVNDPQAIPMLLPLLVIIADNCHPFTATAGKEPFLAGEGSSYNQLVIKTCVRSNEEEP